VSGDSAMPRRMAHLADRRFASAALESP